MPVYKLICNLPELPHNGKVYRNGDVIMERVVVTEAEAKVMNERQTETILKLTEETKGQNKRPLNQMNKTELLAVAKEIDLELDETLTRPKMCAEIEKRQKEIAENNQLDTKEPAENKDNI